MNEKAFLLLFFDYFFHYTRWSKKDSDQLRSAALRVMGTFVVCGASGSSCAPCACRAVRRCLRLSVKIFLLSHCDDARRTAHRGGFLLSHPRGDSALLVVLTVGEFNCSLSSRRRAASLVLSSSTVLRGSQYAFAFCAAIVRLCSRS